MIYLVISFTCLFLSLDRCIQLVQQSPLGLYEQIVTYFYLYQI
ncbi:hypothetical protein GYH30_029701 [Glycine max]|nr:hypothetical protein GYH30_029701 [Glycine max]